MGIENWMRDMVNWYSYWAGSSTPERATYEGAVKRFGSLDRADYDTAVNEAERGIDAVQLFRTLDIDQPLSAALAGETPPSAKVEVRAWAWIEVQGGAREQRSITIEVPWTTGVGEVNALLWEAAMAMASGYGQEPLEVEMIAPLRFPRNP